MSSWLVIWLFLWNLLKVVLIAFGIVAGLALYMQILVRTPTNVGFGVVLCAMATYFAWPGFKRDLRKYEQKKERIAQSRDA